MTIGERLKMLRKEHDLTQTELSKELKLGQTTIAAYENDTHEPNLYGLKAYADFFNCTIDYLVGFESDDTEIIADKNSQSDIQQTDEQQKNSSYVSSSSNKTSKKSQGSESSKILNLINSEYGDPNNTTSKYRRIAALKGSKSNMPKKGVSTSSSSTSMTAKDMKKLREILNKKSKSAILETNLLSIYNKLNNPLKQILIEQAIVLYNSSLNV